MTVGAPVRAGTGSEWSITCGGNWLKKHKLGLVVVSLLLIFLEWLELATIQNMFILVHWNRDGSSDYVLPMDG